MTVVEWERETWLLDSRTLSFFPLSVVFVFPRFSCVSFPREESGGGGRCDHDLLEVRHLP